MARVNEKEAARDRVLSDDELRALWRVTEATPMPHGHFVRFLPLTAVRRNEAAKMVREEVSPDGTWIIPAVRMKAKQEHVVPLSPAARAILDDLPNVSRYVFTTTGFSAIRNFWSFKEKLDAEMLPALRRAAEGRGEDPGRISVAPWVLHDLRRTARSLMSRAQVNPDIAERVLAHTIGGVRGVYDRYAYIEEKRHALKALAAMIERIVSPPADNVVPMRSGETA